MPCVPTVSAWSCPPGLAEWRCCAPLFAVSTRSGSGVAMAWSSRCVGWCPTGAGAGKRRAARRPSDRMELSPPAPSRPRPGVSVRLPAPNRIRGSAGCGHVVAATRTAPGDCRGDRESDAARVPGFVRGLVRCGSMPRLTRIYTRTGDDGSTGLGGGQRVAKDSLRIATFGTVDELNSVLGVALAEGALRAFARAGGEDPERTLPPGFGPLHLGSRQGSPHRAAGRGTPRPGSRAVDGRAERRTGRARQLHPARWCARRSAVARRAHRVPTS